MSLYVWQVKEEDGRWGTISAAVPEAGAGVIVPILPLVHRDRSMADHLGTIAAEHHKRTGLPVRLARFEYAGVLEEWP